MQQSATSTGVVPFGTLPVPHQMLSSLELIRAGLESGLAPSLTDEGTSGTYVLTEAIDEDTVRPVAFWKPIDEEPFAPNNPRGMQAPFGSATCRQGVKSGESTLREVLAYLLDHEGFAGVPPTALVEVFHPSLEILPFSDDQVTTKEFRNLISGLLMFQKQQRKNLDTIVAIQSPSSSPSRAVTTTSSPSSTDVDSLNHESSIRQGKLGSL